VDIAGVRVRGARLPEPRATCPEVRPGVDIVVEPAAEGFEQFFLVNRLTVLGDL
jgi:hypothetical protein